MSAAPKISEAPKALKIPEGYRESNKKFSYFNDIADQLRDGLNFEEQYYIMHNSYELFFGGIQIKELAIEKKDHKVEIWIKGSKGLGLIDFGSTWSGQKEDITKWDDKYMLLEKFVKLPEGYQFINGNEFLKNKKYFIEELPKQKYKFHSSTLFTGSFRISGITYYHAFKLKEEKENKNKNEKENGIYEYSAKDVISGGAYNVFIHDDKGKKQICVSGTMVDCVYQTNEFNEFFKKYVLAMRINPKKEPKKGGTRRRRRGSKGGSRKNRRSRKSM